MGGCVMHAWTTTTTEDDDDGGRRRWMDWLVVGAPVRARACVRACVRAGACRYIAIYPSSSSSIRVGHRSSGLVCDLI